MTKVTIESSEDCDEEITIIAKRIEKVIDLAKETSNPNLALAIVNDKLSELGLRQAFHDADIL